MIVHPAEQRSAEWLKARAGLPTASQFDRIVTSTGKISAQGEAYARQLAGERVLGYSEELPMTKAMERGIELEYEARSLYAMRRDVEPVETGLILEDGGRWGCSPDGLCGDDGGLELKCPGVAVHVGYLIEGTLPTAYFAQVQGCLFVTGRKWWDFASYFPGLPMFLTRVTPDEKWHEMIGAALPKLVERVTEIEAELRRLAA